MATSSEHNGTGRLKPATDAEHPRVTTSTAAAWGIAVPTRRRLLTAITRTARRLVAAVMLGAVLLLGGTVALLAPTSSPAHADILGISSSVQDWICGFVNPSEPWGALGDGPESWLSNLNLAQARQVPVLHVDSAGSTFSAATPPSTGIPQYMDQLPALPAGDYTLYEIAGLRGLNWWTIPLTPDGKNRDCDLWNYVWSEAGNLVFTANKVLLQVVIATKEAAASNNPLSFLYDDAAGAVSTVFSAFFVPVATLMLILAGIWAAVAALRQKGLRALIGAIGAAAAIMALGGFMYSVLSTGTNGFRSVAAIADESISQVNAAATNALFDNLTGNTGACSLPEDTGSAVRGQRLTSCILADSLAYRPWAVGQFGGAGANPIPVPEGWTVLHGQRHQRRRRHRADEPDRAALLRQLRRLPGSADLPHRPARRYPGQRNPLRPRRIRGLLRGSSAAPPPRTSPRG